MIVKGGMTVAEFELDFYAEFEIPCDVVFEGEVAPNNVSLSSFMPGMLDAGARKRLQVPDHALVSEIRRVIEEEFGFSVILYRVEAASDHVTLASLWTQDLGHAIRDRNLRVEYDMTVETFESHFLAAFGVYCDVLEGGRPADNGTRLISLQQRSRPSAGSADIHVNVNMLVSTVKKIIKETLGLEVEFYRLCPVGDDDSLENIRHQSSESAVARARKDRILKGTDVYLSPDEDKFVSGKTLRRRYWHPVYHATPVSEVLTIGENATIEFKSSGRWNYHKGGKDQDIELALAKTVAGFLNAGGGTLLIGVDDVGKPVGLENDFKLLKKTTRDGYELWLTDFLGNVLGLPAATNVAVIFEQIMGFDIARLDVHSSGVPVFVKIPKNNIDRFFYVRINNATRQLAVDDVLAYVEQHWNY